MLRFVLGIVFFVATMSLSLATDPTQRDQRMIVRVEPVDPGRRLRDELPAEVPLDHVDQSFAATSFRVLRVDEAGKPLDNEPLPRQGWIGGGLIDLIVGDDFGHVVWWPNLGTKPKFEYTLHGPAPKIGWTGNWGMAASAEDKDYVHLLTSQIAKAAGGMFVDISKLGFDETNDARAERMIEHAGVAGHPRDKGMQALADALWKAIHPATD